MSVLNFTPATSSECSENLLKDKVNEILENPHLIKQLEIALSADPDVQISGLILKSDKHEQFNKLLGNREINESNLKKLAGSINEHGYKVSQPITIDECYNVVDGQHRLKICEDLDLPVYFTIETTTDSLKITQDLNRNQKNWSLNDYINSYADRGYDDYKNFIELYKSENISISLAIWLLYKSRNGLVQAKIRDGQLECKDRDMQKVRQTVRLLRSIRDCIPSNLPKEIAIRNAIFNDKVAVPLMVIMSEPNYNHRRMLKQISQSYNSIDKRNMSTAGDSLVEIYNYRLGKESRARLRDYSSISSVLQG